MQQNQLEFLLWGYFNKSLDGEQRQELFALIRNDHHQEQIEQFIQQLLEQQQTYPECLDENTSNDILRAIQQLKKMDTPPEKRGSNIRIYRWIYAAAAIVAIAAYIAIRYWPGLPVQHQVRQANFDIPETRYGAVLTLPQGNRVVLNKLPKDTSFSNNGIGINIRRGVLYFSMLELSNEFPGDLYTVTTSHGQQFGLVMPDGTRVWLNAVSAISFPGFNNKTVRAATMTGEAFFEVSPGAPRPFTVKTSGGTEVHVLGTSFNINAYGNEPAQTATLLNGKIKLVTPRQNIVMNPGEQAIINEKNDRITVVKGVDTSDVLAWKKGFLNVKGMTLQALGRQIGRWYNLTVEVDPGSSLHEIKLGGSLSQDIPLPDLMAALETFGVHAKIKDNHLFISAGKPG